MSDESLFDLALVTPQTPVDEYNRALPAISAEVVEVFNFWVETLRASSANSVRLSEERRKKIATAVKNYGVQTCRDAILGCSESDFHMGRNGRGKKYDDITLILRDAKHIEDFARLHLEGE